MPQERGKAASGSPGPQRPKAAPAARQQQSQKRVGPRPLSPEAVKRREDCITWLCASYPAAFCEPVKPLKLRILEDLSKVRPEGTSKLTLRRALHWWTNSSAYLKTLAGGGQRHDLDGQPVGAISEKHQRHARECLGRRKRQAKGKGEAA